MATQKLDAKQAKALLDILSHHEIYAEIRDFRQPGAIEKYGPPFEIAFKTPSNTPSLQTLLSRYILIAPGLRDVDKSFWKERVAAIIRGFQDAELSESYDKGLIGIRKTLATAISALLEYPVRGVFAGFDEPSDKDVDREYDTSKAEDLQRAFRDLSHRVVYGDSIDELVKKVRETDKLSDHTPLTQASHEYILVNLASFMHYTLIISPKGQQMLTLLDQANRLIPYGIVKQTLRIGNVASMINAMMKVVLAKVSIASVTNWVGWTQGANEGMNLMQHIISQVLQWDIRDLKSKSSKLEKDKKGPKKEHLEAMKSYLQKSRAEHERIRKDSLSHEESIVAAILSAVGLSTKDLSDSQHSMTQDYLTIQLAIRDREQIVNVLCKSNPDHLTQAVRDGVKAYEPLIRQIHSAVDLSDHLTDLEVFIKDLIKLSKIGDGAGKGGPPTIGDFVQLLHKHQGALHRFLHQAAKNATEITQTYQAYLNKIVANFRRSSKDSLNDAGAGELTASLQEMYQTMPEQSQAQGLKTLDQHSAYLASLHAASETRLRSVLASSTSKQNTSHDTKSDKASSRAPPAESSVSNPSTGKTTKGLDVNPGPGAYLARWQSLIDESEITPAKAHGGVRSGGDGSVLKASRVGADTGVGTAEETDSQISTHTKDDDDESDEEVFEEAHESMDQYGLPEGDKVKAPDVRELVERLLPGFRELLAKKACDW